MNAFLYIKIVGIIFITTLIFGFIITYKITKKELEENEKKKKDKINQI